MAAIPHVLFDANGKAVNRFLLSPNSGWQPPDGFTIAADPDGLVWAAAIASNAENLPPPAPSYRAFYDALLASQVYGAVVTTPGKSGDQAAAMTVFLGAIQDALSSRENRPALQQAIWLLLGQLQLNAAGLAELQGLMDQHDLAGFYSLFPMPPAQTLGQTWTDPSGDEWVAVQARSEDGQFLPDNPATPQRESLIWERVA